jgi:uncharacterized membrane protein
VRDAGGAILVAGMLLLAVATIRNAADPARKHRWFGLVLDIASVAVTAIGVILLIASLFPAGSTP